VEEKTKKPKTMKIPVIISISISLIIIFFILYFTIDADTISQLGSTKIKYEFFILAILLSVLYWFLWGARIMVLSNAMDKNVNISFIKSTKIVLANMFLASITPSMAGGEPVRIHLLKKEGMNLGSATAVVLGERLIDAIYIIILLPIAFFIYHGVSDLGFIGIGLMIGVFVFLIVIFLFIYSILKPEKVKSALIYINKKTSRFFKRKESQSKVTIRINKEVDNFHNGMMKFTGEGKKALVKASAITIVFWLSGFMIPSMILLGLGLPPFFIESFAAQVLLLVIIMMPTTPGSAGVAEAGIYGLYGVLIGTGEGSLIGVFLILYRFVTYYSHLFIGAFFQYRIFHSVASFSMDMIKKDE